MRHALHVNLDVLAGERRQVERHVIVYALTGEAHVGQHSDLGVARNNAYLGLGRIVLHGQQQVALRLGYGHNVLFASQMAYRQLRLSRGLNRRKAENRPEKNHI